MEIVIKRIRQISVLLFLTLFLLATISEAAEIAIVVNKGNGLEDLSLLELEKVLKGEKEFWGNGKRIKLVLRPLDSKEAEILLKKVYKIPREEFERYWLERVYAGKVKEAPLLIGSAAAANMLVGQVQEAIAPIEAGSVSKWASVKILKIDGKGPGEKDYPLRNGE
jgi:hypothetical protein